MIPFPYENTNEFIRAKAAIQDRFLQVIPGRHANPTEEKKLEAYCNRLRELAELHRHCLRARDMSEIEHLNLLCEGIERECRQMFGTAGPLYPQLEICRDSLLREMAGNRSRKAANPSKAPSRRSAKAKSIPATSGELDSGPSRKGDPELLGDETVVLLSVADQFLGITSRGRQKAVKAGKLDIVGFGQGKKVTVESLLRYAPPSKKTN